MFDVAKQLVTRHSFAPLSWVKSAFLVSEGLWCFYDNKQTNVRFLLDMKFLVSCSMRYLTTERSEQVRYQIEQEKRNSPSTSNHVWPYCGNSMLLTKYTHGNNFTIFLAQNITTRTRVAWVILAFRFALLFSLSVRFGYHGNGLTSNIIPAINYEIIRGQLVDVNNTESWNA